MPAPGARGFFAAAVFAGATFFAAVVFFAGAAAFPGAAFFAPYFAAGSRAVSVLPAAVLRGGNFDVRGSNSKVTLPSSLFHARKALNARRVRMETNLSSKS